MDFRYYKPSSSFTGTETSVDINPENAMTVVLKAKYTINKLYLYKSGNEYTGITGGWNISAYSYNGGFSKDSDAFRYTRLVNPRTAITVNSFERGEYTKVCGTIKVESGNFPVTTPSDGIGSVSLEIRDNSTGFYDAKSAINGIGLVSFGSAVIGQTYTACADLTYSSRYDSSKAGQYITDKFWIRWYFWSSNGGACSIAMKETRFE